MRTEPKPAVSERVAPALRKPATAKLAWFTLAELIVVVTILAILATVGFLALSGYSQDAKDASVKANVRSVYTAISSESAITNNSPRYYVVHDAAAALTGSAVAYVDGNPVALTGWDWNQAGTNYSAGNPDWAKLRLNPDKFRLSLRPPMGGFLSLVLLPDALAAYDPKQVSVWALDAALAPTASGRSRSTSFFQVAGTAPATGSVSIAGNFPAPTAAQVSAGAVRGLVKSPDGNGALVDGGASSATSGSAYPGCDVPDITLANGQVWAACNVGASNAWTGGVTITNCSAGATDCDASIRNTLGSYFQWGRNEDVTALGSGTTLATAGSSASTAMGYFVKNGTSPYDWIATQNGNLWGGSGTSLGNGTFAVQASGDRAAMKGPCASGYHVPTQAEWWSAINTLNPALTNTATWQNDTALATTLKLPLAGNRHFSSAAYVNQGTYGFYWASSPTGTNGHNVNLSATQVYPASNSNRATGLSVRCLAN